jgi:hypothetical protein
LRRGSFSRFDRRRPPSLGFTGESSMKLLSSSVSSSSSSSSPLEHLSASLSSADDSTKRHFPFLDLRLPFRFGAAAGGDAVAGMDGSKPSGEDASMIWSQKIGAVPTNVFKRQTKTQTVAGIVGRWI